MMSPIKYIALTLFILLTVGSHQVYQRGFFTLFDQEYIERVSAESAEIIISEASPVILDVRDLNEFNTSHLEGAIRYDEFNFEDLNPESPVLLYCTVGLRSNKAALSLREAGFKNIYELRDGLIGWANADLPVVDKDNQETEAVHVYYPAFRYLLKTGEAVY